MITLSDHHPVSADFDIDVSATPHLHQVLPPQLRTTQVHENDSHKSHGVALSLFKKLGEFEDSAIIPTVTILDGPDVHLGSVT